MTNRRVNDLTNYLEALSSAQASGYKCSEEMREVVRAIRQECGMMRTYEDDYNEYLRRILFKCEDRFTRELSIVNAQIFQAYKAKVAGDLYFKRCTGVSTSIEALTEMYDDVVYIRDINRMQHVDVTDKVVFREGFAQLSRGTRPKVVINIRSIDVVGGENIAGKTFDIAHII